MKEDGATEIHGEGILEYIDIYSVFSFACDLNILKGETFALRKIGIIKVTDQQETVYNGLK